MIGWTRIASITYFDSYLDVSPRGSFSLLYFKKRDHWRAAVIKCFLRHGLGVYSPSNSENIVKT
jgi:hypothetical protein